MQGKRRAHLVAAEALQPVPVIGVDPDAGEDKKPSRLTLWRALLKGLGNPRSWHADQAQDGQD
jgi:hypothetical protein